MANVYGHFVGTLVREDVFLTTGQTTAIVAPYNHLLTTNGSTIAAQTLTLPANPVDGDLVFISNVAAITAVTYSPTVSGAPSGLTAGQGIILGYSANIPGWFVVKS